MHRHQYLGLATQSSTTLFPRAGSTVSKSSRSGSWHLSSSGWRRAAVAAAFACDGRKEQHCRAVSLQATRISGPYIKQQLFAPKGLVRVLLGKQRELKTRPRSQADTESDSLEDLNIEDMDDEELDDLFENYGEVVREESVPTPTSSEVDDDAESLELAVALAEVANEVKASEIRVLCVKPLVYWTRFFVIATGFSRPQVDAIGQRMRNLAEERFKRTPKGDLKPNAWTLLDFGDVVVHIFYPKERSFYNLEEFYANATSVELPFQSESQSQVL
ncbi:unnamed protein product [Calypogeia fissa]